MEVLAVARFSEAQLALVVLGVLVVAVALLSYFVVAPEYEKRLELQYAALYPLPQQHHVTHTHQVTHAVPRRHHVRRLRSVDIEAGSSDDDGRRLSALGLALPPPQPKSTGGSTGPVRRLTLRRKSESDALKAANVARADMLRRRVALRRLEEEIEGAKRANNAQTAASRTRAAAAGRALSVCEDKLIELAAHPAECEEEFKALARGAGGGEARQALQTVHDVLALALSVDHRDLNRVTVLCNSLLKHDGLNRLRALELHPDEAVRRLATAVIEKAVPAIWH